MLKIRHYAKRPNATNFIPKTPSLMKTTLTLLPLLFALCLSAQTQKTKLKKVVTQDKMTSVATISGLYYGATTPQQLLRDKKNRISNNQDNWKIISYTFTFLRKETYAYLCKPQTVSHRQLLRNYLKETPRTKTRFTWMKLKPLIHEWMNPIDLINNLYSYFRKRQIII